MPRSRRPHPTAPPRVTPRLPSLGAEAALAPASRSYGNYDHTARSPLAAAVVPNHWPGAVDDAVDASGYDDVAPDAGDDAPHDVESALADDGSGSADDAAVDGDASDADGAHASADPVAEGGVDGMDDGEDDAA